MNEILPYYAGFIDGEAHIGIKKVMSKKGIVPTYSERISVAGCSKLAIESFNDLMQGHIYYHRGSRLSNRGYWSWEVTDNKAKLFLRIIRPYLKVKALEADLVLGLSKNKEKNNHRPVSTKDLSLRESLYRLTKYLHHKHE